MKKYSAEQRASYALALAALDRERACATVAGLYALFAAEGTAAVPRQMFISELKVVLQQFLDPRWSFEKQAVRRLRLSPRKCLVSDGELLAWLDGPLKVMKKPDGLVLTGKATNFNDVAAIVAGVVKDDRSMEALRARADGGAGSLVAIEFKQASRVQRARGVPQVEVTRALVNPMGAMHINKPAVSAADRVLVERFARTMPFRFSETDKFVNEDVVDTCCQLVARSGETAAAAGHRAPLAYEPGPDGDLGQRVRRCRSSPPREQLRRQRADGGRGQLGGRQRDAQSTTVGIAAMALLRPPPMRSHHL
jgi:hypothetical protein